MNLEFRKISGFNRGILHQLLVDSYSFDSRWQKYFEPDWIDFDNFFFDNLDIADSCGLITVWNDTPIGHVSWDPRNRPEYVQIGHNCIATAYKGNGYCYNFRTGENKKVTKDAPEYWYWYEFE